MKQIKAVFIVIVLSLLVATNLYAFDSITDLTIPNSTSQALGLPVGLPYATVEQTDIVCPGSTTGVRMVVTPNQSILVPVPTGGSYGVQEFGFNYSNSNSGCLNDVSDLTITKPGHWTIKNNSTIDGFGRYLVDESNNGQYRQDPLTIDICAACSDLSPANFLVTNTAGYVFAAHIAPFTYDGIPQQTLNSSFFATQNQTLVELIGFEAIPGRNKVTLIWATGSEVDNAGFNIYRAGSADGEYVQINKALITAEGSPTAGAGYTFTDAGVQNRKTYYYQLEDVDLSGNSTMHGPVSAAPRLLRGVKR